ncbi:MAG: hypothetical protein I8H71_00300 [Xanthomonadaceae bacterium]|nr:hypothetical protein [Xanthomonadaceae bacterium]MBH2008113.1 hypothetical protein [Xanthomonadaceae bacterium]
MEIVMDRQPDLELRGHLMALHVAVAFLLARDAGKSGQPLSKLHELLTDELQQRLATAPQIEAHAVHMLDMLASNAQDLLVKIRPK